MLGHHNIHFLLHLPLTLKIYLKTVTYTYMFKFKCVLKQIFFTVIVKLWCFVIKFLCSSGLLWVLCSPFQALSHRLHVWTIPARHNVIMYHFLNYISTLMPWLCSHPTTHRTATARFYQLQPFVWNNGHQQREVRTYYVEPETKVRNDFTNMEKAPTKMIDTCLNMVSRDLIRVIVKSSRTFVSSSKTYTQNQARNFRD